MSKGGLSEGESINPLITASEKLTRHPQLLTLNQLQGSQLSDVRRVNHSYESATVHALVHQYPKTRLTNEYLRALKQQFP